ncbi:MAG: ABC transporter ATP-binding protein [Deltaproteobacteria bacterium]|nr:ABC transporter ATP-binding protein [Deltaproteobacteria bacterium]
MFLRPQLPALLFAAIFMSIVAASTAGYAYLVGPVLKSLFLTSETASSAEVASPHFSWITELAARLVQASPYFIGGLIIGVAVIKGIAFFMQRLLVIRAGQRVLYDLRERMYNGVLQMNPLFREKDTSGNIVSRFSVDSHVVEQAVTGGIMSLVSNVLQIVALTTMAFSLSMELGLLGLVGFPPIAVMISKLGRVLRARQGQFYDAWHGVSQIVDESVLGLGLLQSFGAEQFAQKRFDAQNRALRHHAASALSVSAFSSPLNEILGTTALGVTLWYAQLRIESGHLTPEAFISFFTALFLLYRPVKGFGMAVHALQTGFAALDKLGPLLSPTNRFTGREVSSEGVTLKDVTAGYDRDQAVLRQLTLTIAPGEKVAVVGESGSGKTTLLNVLCGYLAPSGGTVESPWPVAVVPQIPFLFDETIYANVALGNPNITNDMVERACLLSGVFEFCEKLDGGLLYKVGQNGKNLSAGERQRVCLARALASGRTLLLLDEVTAALDGKNENIITDSLAGLTDVTVVAVTHRARTAAFAARTVVLENGTIVDEGTFDDLMERSQVVQRLFASS